MMLDGEPVDLNSAAGWEARGMQVGGHFVDITLDDLNYTAKWK